MQDYLVNIYVIILESLFSAVFLVSVGLIVFSDLMVYVSGSAGGINS